VRSEVPGMTEKVRWMARRQRGGSETAQFRKAEEQGKGGSCLIQYP